MSMIRWIFLAAMAAGFVLLAVSNWTLVDFVLPNGRLAPVPLPLLLAGAFLAGAVPTWLWLGLMRPLIDARRSSSPIKSSMIKSGMDKAGMVRAERTEIAAPADQPAVVPPASL